jgi:hypothetical protein
MAARFAGREGARKSRYGIADARRITPLQIALTFLTRLQAVLAKPPRSGKFRVRWPPIDRP